MVRLLHVDRRARRRLVSPRRFRLRHLAPTAALALCAAGCGTHTGGDPGGKRLKELGNDPVFAVLPPRATIVKLTRTPARYRQPAFQTGGWDGPSVSLVLRSPAPRAAVYRFYNRRAEAAGWRVTAVGGLGLPDSWRKTYPDGAPAYLSFALLTPFRSERRRLYMLAGGVAPVVR